MLKSSRIPPLLNRICQNGISSAYLITTDGALLGASSSSTTTSEITSASSSPLTSSSFHLHHPMDPSDLAALVAEVVEDYRKLGSELSLLKKKEDLIPPPSPISSTPSPSSSTELKKNKFCVLIQLENGVLGIASATDTTYVVALGQEGVQHGWMKMQLYSLASHVCDSGMY